MESSFWPSAQIARGLKMQLESASSSSSSPGGGMCYPQRRAWALSCFSHVPRGFLQIKRSSRALRLFTVSVHRGFPTHLFALFSIVSPRLQAQQPGGGEGAIGVPLISPHGTSPVRLAACKEHRGKKKKKKSFGVQDPAGSRFHHFQTC